MGQEDISIKSGTVTTALEKVDRVTGQEFKHEHLYLDAKDYCFSDDGDIDLFAAFLKDRIHQLDQLRSPKKTGASDGT